MFRDLPVSMHNQLRPVLVCRKGTTIASLCKVCPWSRFDFFATLKLDKMHQIYTQAWRLHLTWQDLRMDFRLSRAPRGEDQSSLDSKWGGRRWGRMWTDVKSIGRSMFLPKCFLQCHICNYIATTISLLVMLPSTSFMQRLCSVQLFLSVLGLWQQRSSKAFHIALPHNVVKEISLS